MSVDDEEEVDPVGPDDDEGPDLTDDDFVDVDVDPELAEDVATDVADDVDDSGDSDGAGPEDIGPEGDSSSRSVSPGDIYCNALGMGAVVSRQRYGSLNLDDDRDRDDVREEYADMARDLEIDSYVDEWLEEQGGVDELSPGQAILISTGLFASFVAIDDPALAESIAEGT